MSSSAPSQLADLILRNGVIITMSDGTERAAALAIRDERIVAVGTAKEVERYAAPSARIVDLGGRTAIPGLIDAHAHMDREGLKELFPSLAGARSIKDIQQRIAKEAANRAAGSWIVTMPLGEPPYYFDPTHEIAERRWPTRWDLDAAAPNHPVYIRAPFGYWNRQPLVSAANSRALELCGVTARSTPPVSTITIEVDERRGEPTGVFIEDHTFPVVELTLMAAAPRFSCHDRIEGLRRSMARYARMGITTIYEGHGVAADVLEAYQALPREDFLVRCYLAPFPGWGSLEEAGQFFRSLPESATASGMVDPWFHLGGIALPLGSGGGSKELIELLRQSLPYTGWGGYVSQAIDAQEYEAYARLAMQHGLRINTIDARQVDRIVDIWERLTEETGARQLRHVLVHLRGPAEHTLRRLKDLGAVVTTIPMITIWKEGAGYIERPTEEQELTPHRAVLDHGIPLAMATDNCPVNPFAVMWSAETRQVRSGGATLGSRQCITRLEALQAWTVGGAYLCGMENQLGRLAPGYFADLVVLDDDLFAVPADRLPDIRPVLTMAGGKITYGDPGKNLAIA